jgi:hypothetical protein
MKKWLLVLIAVVIASGGAAFLLKGYQEKWTLETGRGTEMVLSLKGTSATTQSSMLQIRCDGHNAEVRLYIPIRIMPPAGMAAGPATLEVSEEFRDRDRKIVAGDSRAGEQFNWIVAEGGAYASRTGSATFIERIAGHDWLYLHSLGFSSDRLATSTIMFPLKGLADHKARVAAACRGARQ